MELLVWKNFQVIKDFEEHLIEFRRQNLNRSSVMETLLGRFDDVLEKVLLLCLVLITRALKCLVALIGNQSRYCSG